MYVVFLCCFCAVLVQAGEICSQLSQCFSTPPVINSTMVLNNPDTGTITISTNILDVYCSYLSGIDVCTKEYENVCNKDVAIFEMVRNIHKTICEDYKTELIKLISVCFNDPPYQSQLMTCYENAVEIASGDCDMEMDSTATCIQGVVQQCSPENTHVIIPILEALKPWTNC